MRNFNINTGLKSYTINGDESKVIYINTSDLGIPKRAKQAEKELKKIADECANIEDSLSIDESIELLDKFDGQVKKIIDYIFNADVSEVVFGRTNSLSMVDGKPVFQNFLDAVIPEIVKDTDKEYKKSQKNITKYTSQVKNDWTITKNS